MLGLRFILRLFGASSGAPFTNWVFETTRPLLEPFLGMFPAPAIDGGFVIEFTTLFAILAYSLIGYLLVALLRWLEDAAWHRRQVYAHRHEHPHTHEHAHGHPREHKHI